MKDFNLFENENILNNDIIDGLEVINIPIEEIGDEADVKAKQVIENLAKFYYDEEFLKQNPNFRKRIENDMESLRMLLKMRAADEVTHDVLIKSIANNSGNASLYKALTNVQSTILSITTKIEGILNNLSSMIKNYQLEINFKQEQEIDNSQETELNTSQHRGTKSFIEAMNKLENNEND